jgi:antitoxin VapB
MALNIKNEQTHALARRLAELTGETLTEAVTTAVRERLEHVQQEDEQELTAAGIAEIQRFLAALPDLDTRCADDILGYDAFGLPR